MEHIYKRQRKSRGKNQCPFLQHLWILLKLALMLFGHKFCPFWTEVTVCTLSSEPQKNHKMMCYISIYLAMLSRMDRHNIMNHASMLFFFQQNPLVRTSSFGSIPEYFSNSLQNEQIAVSTLCSLFIPIGSCLSECWKKKNIYHIQFVYL